MTEKKAKDEKRLYQDTWAGNYWGRDGAIRQSEARSRAYKGLDIQEINNGLSSLSSTYYSAAGQAAARFKVTRSPLGKLLWGFRAWRCLHQAEKVSDELARPHTAYNVLTAEQLDVRARILFKCRRHKEAFVATVEALTRKPAVDTEVLLRVGLAEIYDIIGENDEAAREYRKAGDVVVDTKPTTRVRFYRSWGQRELKLRHFGSARHCVTEALVLSQANGLDDQIIKLEPLLKALKKAGEWR